MSDFKTMTRDQLEEHISSDEDVVLIDTLNAMSYQRAHLPGAINIDAHEDDFLDRVAEEVPEKDTPIIVYCASFSCGLSEQAATQLVEAGYTNVTDYEGGLKDWATGGNRLEGEDARTVRDELAKAA